MTELDDRIDPEWRRYWWHVEVLTAGMDPDGIRIRIDDYRETVTDPEANPDDRGVARLMANLLELALAGVDPSPYLLQVQEGIATLIDFSASELVAETEDFMNGEI